MCILQAPSSIVVSLAFPCFPAFCQLLSSTASRSFRSRIWVLRISWCSGGMSNGLVFARRRALSSSVVSVGTLRTGHGIGVPSGIGLHCGSCY